MSTFRPAEGDTPAGAEAPLWTLRFISGKYQGGEFPLRPHREIIIGRSSDLDMVLVEDMVSRRHAKITTDARVVSIEDLGSTNGTFVNGEKVKKCELKDGDRILVGTSIIKLIAVDAAAAPNLSENEARSRMAVTANKRTVARSMAGSIEEIPLPDLLQLLSTSRKSGVLVLKAEWGTGKLYLRKGQIYFASIDDAFDMSPRKAIFRMLGWTTGFFELEPPDERAVLEELQDSTEALLMEGMRQLDELRALGDSLPQPNARLTVPRPLSPKLRDLTPEELDLFQAALTADTVQALFDQSRATDLAVAQKLKVLVDKGYLVAG